MKTYPLSRAPRILLYAALCLYSYLALGVVSLAHAQAVPDAGSLRQQIEQQRALPVPPAVRPERATPPPEIAAPVGITVWAQSFRFAGNTLLSAEQLALTLAGFVGRELDFAGLQRATQAVATRYRAAGWIARVYLPEQDISTGVVTLQVVEARYAGLRWEGAAPTRVPRAEIAPWFQAHQADGAFLNAEALDRALLLVDDLPGVSVSGTLAPGQAQGQTALLLQATDEPLLYGDIGLDNTGARSTGSQRVTANLNFNSPGGRGELVALNLIHTQGSDYGRIAMTVPDGYNGLRLGVNASSMNYKVVEGAASITRLQVRGGSDSLGLDWSYPLLRTRLHNLYFSGGLDHKAFTSTNTNADPSDPTSFSDYESNSTHIGFSGNLFDGLGGGGASSASAQLLWGRLANIKAHSQFGTIEPGYSKLNFSASRQQTLAPQHSLLASLQGQYATQVLDSSEKLYIGGAQTVRAYPTSELGGERGHVLSAEWRWQLDSAWVLSAFIDHGQVTALPTTSTDTATTLALQGHGVSLAWQGPLGISTKLTWSHRMGSNPKPTSTGTDGDGTLEQDRFWLTLSMPF